MPDAGRTRPVLARATASRADAVTATRKWRALLDSNQWPSASESRQGEILPLGTGRIFGTLAIRTDPNGSAGGEEGVNGAPGWSRTSGLWLRRPTLYPSELRARGGSRSPTPAQGQALPTKPPCPPTGAGRRTSTSPRHPRRPTSLGGCTRCERSRSTSSPPRICGSVSRSNLACAGWYHAHLRPWNGTRLPPAISMKVTCFWPSFVRVIRSLTTMNWSRACGTSSTAPASC